MPGGTTPDRPEPGDHLPADVGGGVPAATSALARAGRMERGRDRSLDSAAVRKPRRGGRRSVVRDRQEVQSATVAGFSAAELHCRGMPVEGDRSASGEEQELATIRDLLRRLIQAKGFTLQDLDAQFGYSRGYMSRLLK